MSNRKRFVWENRDFTVDPNAVVNYVEMFVLHYRSGRRTCDDLAGALDDERFVLYNVRCLVPPHGGPRTGTAGLLTRGIPAPSNGRARSSTSERRAAQPLRCLFLSRENSFLLLGFVVGGVGVDTC